MNCIRCKKELSPEDKYCRNCGKKVKIKAHSVKMKKAFWYLIVIAILALIVIVLSISLGLVWSAYNNLERVSVDKDDDIKTIIVDEKSYLDKMTEALSIIDVDSPEIFNLLKEIKTEGREPYEFGLNKEFNDSYFREKADLYQMFIDRISKDKDNVSSFISSYNDKIESTYEKLHKSMNKIYMGYSVLCNYALSFGGGSSGFSALKNQGFDYISIKNDWADIEQTYEELELNIENLINN